MTNIARGVRMSTAGSRKLVSAGWGCSHLQGGLRVVAGVITLTVLATVTTRAPAQHAETTLPSNRRVTVVGDANFPPYEFRAQDEPRGFNVDLIRAIGDVMGWKTRVTLHPWFEARQAVESKKADIVAMMYSAERDRKVDFSIPHCVVAYDVFSRKGTSFSRADLKSAEIIVQRDDIMHDYVQSRQLGTRIIPVPTPEDALRTLAGGKHDCALLPKVQGLYLAQEYDLPTLRANGIELLTRRYCFAVPEGNALLVSQINEGLNILKATGRYYQIQDRWFGQYQQQASDLPRFLAVGAAVILVVLCIALLWSWSLRREVKEKTRKLRDELTVRKRAENAVRESEQRLELALQGANLGLWDRNLATGKAVFNAQWAQMLGYREDEIEHSLEAWQKLIHPDDADRVSNALEAHIAGKTERYEVEHRLRASDGGWRWILSRGKVVQWSEDGVPLRIAGTHLDITERKETRQDLRFHAILLDSVREAVMAVDEEGRITYWGTGAQRLYQYERGEIVGKQIEELVPPTVRGREARILESVRTQGHWEGAYRQMRKDGTEFWADAYVSLIRDQQTSTAGFIAIVYDATQRRLELEARRQSEERYRMLFREMLSGFAVYEIIRGDNQAAVDYRFLEVNPAFERLTGLLAREIIGKTVREILPTLDPEWLEYFHRVAASGEASHFEKYTDTFNRWFEVTVFCPETNKLASIFQDITGRKTAEGERQKLEYKVQQAQKLESLGVLAGGIAHDFNNLLMGVLGNAELTRDELPPGSPALETLAEIEKAAQRAADLCRQMLAYSGKGQFVVESVALNDMVQAMTNLLEISIAGNAVLRINLAPDLPVVRGDPSQLRQVIVNLVTNASEAVGEGSGIINLTTGVMDCSREYLASTFLDEDLRAGTYVYIEITDTGRGMDPATCERIFDPFYTTKFTGRGLGLAAVLGIVRGHHGAINVYSEPDTGTTMKVLLPAAKESTTSTPAQADKERDTYQGAGTILLVDDEKTVRTVGRLMLQKAGFNTLLAADGREAVDLFRDHAEQVSCVLLDLTMPHMSGEETFQQLRQIRPDVKVILSSGYNEHEVVDRFAGKELAGFIQKPYQRERLLSTIREALDPSTDRAT